MSSQRRETAGVERFGSSDLVLGLWLLGLAGFVDAIAFSVLQGSFVAFMSGNTTILGFASAFGEWSVAGLTGLLILLFFVGCAAGASLARWAGRLAHKLLLGSITAVTLIGAIVANTASPMTGVVLLALSGGMTTSALAVNTDVHVGLTYVTGTLVKAAHQLVEGIGTANPWSWLKTFRFWLVFGLGALIGGLAFHALELSSLWIAAGLASVSLLLPYRGVQ